jgi:hypothetical protein
MRRGAYSPDSNGSVLLSPSIRCRVAERRHTSWVGPPNRALRNARGAGQARRGTTTLPAYMERWAETANLASAGRRAEPRRRSRPYTSVRVMAGQLRPLARQRGRIAGQHESCERTCAPRVSQLLAANRERERAVRSTAFAVWIARDSNRTSDSCERTVRGHVSGTLRSSARCLPSVSKILSVVRSSS